MRNKWFVLLGLLALLLGAAAVRAEAPGFSLDWWVVGGGGGQSTGGGFILDGSVVPSGGIATGGSYQLQTGFWYGVLPPAVTPSRWLYLPIVLKALVP